MINRICLISNSRRGELALIFAALLITLGCEERERLNPLDPLNPDTQGKPMGLKVVSETSTVTLSWDKIEVDALSGYRIYRRIEEASYDTTVTVPAESIRYVDFRRPFGVQHVYRISALADTYESPLSDSVTITPGPTYTWAASTYGSTVIRLTHDMRHELMRCPCSLYPWILDVAPGSHSVWVADALFGDVVEVSANGEILTDLGWFRQPSDIALDDGGSHIWIAAQGEDGSGVIHKLTTNGDSLFAKDGFLMPLRLSVDKTMGDCYAADERQGKLFLIEVNGNAVVELLFSFAAPRGIVVDHTRRELWVADGPQVVRYDLRSDSALVVGDVFVKAYSLAVNESTGQCWVVDLGAETSDGRVVLLTAEGDVEFVQRGFVEPVAVSVNLFDGSCVVAEAGADRITRVSATGQAEHLPVNVRQPWDVAVDNLSSLSN